MWNVVWCTLLIVVFSNVCNAAKRLPSSLKLCKRNETALSDCLLKNVEILRPQMNKGIPELYIPALDPLKIPEATLTSGSNFNATFRDIELYHVNDFVFESFSMNLEKPRIELKVKFPHVRIKSNYIVNGRILILNLDGRGPADGNYTNVEGTLRLKGKYFKKNDKDYLEWHQEAIDFSIEKVSLLFEKLFGDNDDLTNQTNKLINENIDPIIVELKPVIEKVMSDVVFSCVNRVFNKYPVDELFPLE